MTVFAKAMLGVISFTLLGALMLFYTDVPPAIAWLNIALFGGGGVVVLLKQLYAWASSRSLRSKQALLANNLGREGDDVGADFFFAFYGLKIRLDPDDENMLDACGAETDARCVAAKRVGLQTHSGRLTDGEDYYLYIGESLGWLGIEHDNYVQLARSRLARRWSALRRNSRPRAFRNRLHFICSWKHGIDAMVGKRPTSRSTRSRAKTRAPG